MKQSGFSLIEILIVIAITGILVSVALPSYRQYTQRAQFTEITQATLPYKLAVTECYQLTLNLQECTSGHHGIPAAQTNEHHKSLLAHIQVLAQGIIIASPKKANGFTPSDVYKLTPTVVNHHLQWTASGQAVERGYAK